jgi:hypothetical protein
LKVERDLGGASAAANLVLPSAKDFAGPDDPSGQKGLREWNENHGPRESNKRPMRPKTERTVF